MRNGDYIEKRVLESAKLILKGNTIREAAKLIKTSKSTVHVDVSHRLPIINPGLHEKVREILLHNWSTKHIRGGKATAEKYLLRSRYPATQYPVMVRTKHPASKT